MSVISRVSGGVQPAVLRSANVQKLGAAVGKVRVRDSAKDLGKGVNIDTKA